MASMLENLELWAKEAHDPEDPDSTVELTEDDWNTCEEVSLEKKSFKDNKITTADWKDLMTKCPALEAFATEDSGITAIETPADGVCEQVQVLDFSKNAIKDLSFVEGFPELISITLTHNTALSDIADLEPLKKVGGTLQMLELDEENLLGCADVEKLREKIWEILPNLVGFNQKDAAGQDLDMDANEYLEEEGFDPEEGDFDFMEEEGDFGEWGEDEDLEEEDEDEEEEDEDDGEPEAKRSKKTE